jgi:hypothetical protein
MDGLVVVPQNGATTNSGYSEPRARLKKSAEMVISSGESFIASLSFFQVQVITHVSFPNERDSL